MRGPSLLSLGASALEWLWRGGWPDRGGWGRKAAYQWRGFWFERNLALQKRLYPSAAPIAPPVFILGPWRAGTTFLHNLLSDCPGMVAPLTWQCMNPSAFLLMRPTSGAQRIRRPMDGVTVSANSAQEDEFALLGLGVPSLYRGFLDPRRLDELAVLLDPEWWKKASTDWLDTWTYFLSGVTAMRKGRLLLKSPTHTFRIMALTREFPGAAYIWLVRDPLAVFHSNRKMWLAMFREYALWDWSENALDAFLEDALNRTAQCLQHAVLHIAKSNLIVVDFADLTTRPTEVVEAISARLHLEKADLFKSAAARAIDAALGYQAERYGPTKVSVEIDAAVEKLNSAQRWALASHGA